MRDRTAGGWDGGHVALQWRKRVAGRVPIAASSKSRKSRARAT
ncbi:hypothetical protein BURCENBC7_AP1633 [Burkholderia cenocepacia BC7]|nr:uncharacterized protein BCN122_II2982 [Burkholderia cenocepacia]EPZ88133.1 hypothetical protein BURCENK562V_C4755 [Burkholderia cenocepacia K56-2Valvano]ERI31756.1 hypothetical protein BURCENBC7_AP1633 [Burkholderia cenocepacia BC7]